MGEVISTRVDLTGQAQVQWKGEFGYGCLQGRVGEMLNFDGEAICGSTKIICLEPYNLESIVKVEHQCILEVKEDCLLSYLLNELGVDSINPYLQ